MNIFHGSSHIVEKPVWGKGKAYNDYGRGFYCTESIEMAKEWACSEKEDGYANAYSIDLNGLKVINLMDEQYNILNWLAILLQNRKFDVSLPMARTARKYIIEHFNIDIKKYDIIIGYRADDSYFSFADDFLNNGISIQQLERTMHLGKLGEQVVLISKKAFERIKFVPGKTEFADKSIYYPLRTKRDKDARNRYLEVERFVEDINGLFVRDIVRKELKNCDFKR